MTKKFLVLLALPATIFAQPFEVNKTVICDKIESVFTVLTGSEFKEKVFWSGKDSNQQTQFVLLSNTETGTWTFVQFTNKVACIIGEGVSLVKSE